MIEDTNDKHEAKIDCEPHCLKCNRNSIKKKTKLQKSLIGIHQTDAQTIFSKICFDIVTFGLLCFHFFFFTLSPFLFIFLLRSFYAPVIHVTISNTSSHNNDQPELFTENTHRKRFRLQFSEILKPENTITQFAHCYFFLLFFFSNVMVFRKRSLVQYFHFILQRFAVAPKL